MNGPPEPHQAPQSQTLARNGLMGSTGIAFQDADKSQLAMAESPASDRIAFALSPP
jgi:hypothetical protein